MIWRIKKKVFWEYCLNAVMSTAEFTKTKKTLTTKADVQDVCVILKLKSAKAERTKDFLEQDKDNTKKFKVYIFQAKTLTNITKFNF